ncbi:short-chain dehydrogenase reductase SDR [Mycena sp. CBHHK59/15]|nr:short-chain dehydrogenase reductase SDR [Mycena sp. CBHHK59/15]
MAANKTIFITGASTGIGLASAKLFHSIGWNVVATMRNPAADHELVQLKDLRMFVQRLDLQDFDSIQPAIDAAIVKFHTIDVLLNNAGYGQNGLFEEIPREKVQEQFDVNLFGLMDVTRGMLPHFRASGGGVVVNVSSGAGLWALPMTSMYSASKFALEGFTEALSYELASQNIYVKSVIPHGGVTSTSFGARFGASSATNPTLTSYDHFKEHIGKSFRSMIAASSVSSTDVAETIRIAATDGTDQLRYLIGYDSRGFVKARYESKSDKEYMDYMHSFFK